jgi:TonB-dependent receptor
MHALDGAVRYWEGNLIYKAHRGGRRARVILLGATILAGGLSTAAFAQSQPNGPIATAKPGAPPAAPAAAAKPSDAAQTVGEIVVTGFRKSLTAEANSKRLSTGFTDSVFAEDIGKFPDLNIAESLQRIPGVQLTRDTNGEGTQISIRGLGPSFAKILLNGSQIAVASDGTLDSGNSNREVDLDMFPTELFTKLTVAKTPTADTVEGGISGTVNMVNVRPFDDPGQHITFNAQYGYGQADNRASPRGALILSKTWGDNLGVLFGFAGASQQYRSDGYETIGYTTPTFNCTGCNVLSGVANQGRGFTFAGGNNPATSTAPQTSGLSALQLSNSLFPRLARDAFIQGARNRWTILGSTQWRPRADLSFTLDAQYSSTDRSFNRLDEDLALRNSGGMTPVNVVDDPNGVVTKATLQNAQLFIEARPYRETVDFYNVNPQAEWKPTDWFQLDAQLNLNRSIFHRSDNTYLFNTPSTLTVDYSNPVGSQIPTINVNAPLNNPNLGYTINSFRIQPAKRVTQDEGAHVDALFGDARNNIKVGAAYDDTYRNIKAFDNSTAANNYALANITTAQIPSLLAPGPTNILHISGQNPGNLALIIQPNYKTLAPAAATSTFDAHPPFSSSSATATPSGTIEEKTSGFYVEANAVSEFFTREVKWNAGVRYFHTDQQITGPITLNGVTSFQTFNSNYNAFLPSFNAALTLGDHLLTDSDHLLLRVAGSRSMTRANPNTMLPGTTFSDPSAQTATQGNPNLKPYFSNNADFGLEYYFMGSGYFAVNLFAKDIDGFTAQSVVSEPFSALGIPLSALNVTQLATGINNNTIISVQTTNNVGSTLALRGMELTYSQPLDFVTKRMPGHLTGFGFTANYTQVDQTPGDKNAIVLGIARNLYTVTGYYENHDVSVHVSYNYIGPNQTAPTGQNNTPYGLFADAHGQVDLSASYTLPWFNRAMQVTFNAVNLNNEKIRTFFGFDSAPYSVYYPGPSYELGLRARF